MPSPEMISGLRQPRAVRFEGVLGAVAPERVQAAPPIGAAGVTVYVSKYAKYRVQISAPQSWHDPTTGKRLSGGEMIVAEFDEGVYRNTERNPEKRAFIDIELQTNKYFGPFGSIAHYWLASDQRDRTEVRRKESAIETIRALPQSEREALLSALQQGKADDHELPPMTTLDVVAEPDLKTGKIARPIPASR